MPVLSMMPHPFASRSRRMTPCYRPWYMQLELSGDCVPATDADVFGGFSTVAVCGEKQKFETCFKGYDGGYCWTKSYCRDSTGCMPCVPKNEKVLWVGGRITSCGDPCEEQHEYVEDDYEYGEDYYFPLGELDFINPYGTSGEAGSSCGRNCDEGDSDCKNSNCIAPPGMEHGVCFGQRCQEGLCSSSCRHDSDCRPGLYCNQKRCTPTDQQIVSCEEPLSCQGFTTSSIWM